MSIDHFNIRVYGIIINDKNEVLLSDEFQLGMKMTKFIGGGLEFGEGPADCIIREIKEECGQEAKIIRHFYTTDFFQQGFFRDNYQVISIYYLVQFKDRINFKISTKSFDFPEMKNGNQSFRWKNILELTPDDVTFPIDKKVVELINVSSM